MSDNKQQAMPLTVNQKETAKRLGMTEKQYAENAAKLIQAGRIKREDIR